MPISNHSALKGSQLMLVASHLILEVSLMKESLETSRPIREAADLITVGTKDLTDRAEAWTAEIKDSAVEFNQLMSFIQLSMATQVKPLLVVFHPPPLHITALHTQLTIMIQ